MVKQKKVKKTEESARVDYKHDHRNHQDNPTLDRTQDSSTPDDDAVGDNELNQVPGGGSLHRE